MDAAGQLRRSENLWFEDGTVVLQAEDTLFRVYSGILARHSQFFQSLLTLPQPQNAEVYDGCPLIRMSGDSAADVREVLQALHGIQWSDAVKRDGLTLAALLELCHKYEMWSVCQRILEILAPMFPTTLAAYSALRARLLADPTDSHLFNSIPEYVALVCALDKTSPHLLPSALLRLTRIVGGSMDFVFDGVQGRSRHVYLPPHLQRALVQGRLKLSILARTAVYPELFKPSTILHCGCGRYQGNALYLMVQDNGYVDPIKDNSQALDEFCAPCKKTLQDKAKMGRSKVWDELPQAFGLPSWEELTKAANTS